MHFNECILQGNDMILQTSKVSLYYEVYGEGRPLILLHGNGEDHKIFDKSIAILKKHFAVYAIDSRGHGESSPVEELHYEDMADDVYEFICKLQLDKPVIYGFSDGGIIALLVGIKYPDVPSVLIGSGVNAKPYAVKLSCLYRTALAYIREKNKYCKLLLTEPDITKTMLQKIKAKVYLTAGSNDLIYQGHMRRIAKNIKKCTYTVFQDEDHGSYIVDSEKIGEYIVKICS